MSRARRFLDQKMKIDWFFLLLVLTLISCGVALVYSATYKPGEVFYHSYWFRQIIYFIVGGFIAVGLAFILIDYFLDFLSSAFTVSASLASSVSFSAALAAFLSSSSGSPIPYAARTRLSTSSKISGLSAR